MYIREEWGYSKHCRIGTNLCVVHEYVYNPEATIYNRETRMDKYTQIVIHISGDVTYSTVYNRYHANALDIFTFDTNELHTIDWTRKQPYERFVICFDNDYFEKVFPVPEDAKTFLKFLDHKRYPALLTLKEQDKDTLTSLINKVDPILGNNDSRSVINTFVIAMQFFELILNVTNAEAEKKQSSFTKRNEIVHRAMLFIDENFREISTNDEVSRAIHISTEYLSKRFKDEMNISMKDYINDKKLNCARHLIDLGCNVSEASAESGFSNTSYFIQLYKKKYGTTPGKK